MRMIVWTFCLYV